MPRLSLRGAILWQRRRSAVAITFSRFVFLYSVFITFIVLPNCFINGTVALLILEHWHAIALCFVLANVASATLLWIGAGGVCARRLFVPWARTQRAPLGGSFYELESESDDWVENDTPDNRWNEYCVLDDDNYVSVTIPGLRPEAMATWLTEQLHRIQEQQLPVARVVEARGEQA